LRLSFFGVAPQSVIANYNAFVNQISLWTNILTNSWWTDTNNIIGSNLTNDASWTGDTCWISNL
jgi:hypothetical protein